MPKPGELRTHQEAPDYSQAGRLMPAFVHSLHLAKGSKNHRLNCKREIPSAAEKPKEQRPENGPVAS